MCLARICSAAMAATGRAPAIRPDFFAELLASVSPLRPLQKRLLGVEKSVPCQWAAEVAGAHRDDAARCS